MGHEHDGPCLLDVYATIGGTGRKLSVAIRRAADWAEHLDGSLEDAVRIARDLVQRPAMGTDPADNMTYMVEATNEERQELEGLLQEATDYWLMCNYAEDSSFPDDQWLGELATVIRGAAICWSPALRRSKGTANVN